MYGRQESKSILQRSVQQMKNESAVPCSAVYITWNGTSGAHCLNCGGVGPNCFSVRHVSQIEIEKHREEERSE